MKLRLTISTPFPYTTLFRSVVLVGAIVDPEARAQGRLSLEKRRRPRQAYARREVVAVGRIIGRARRAEAPATQGRSEEHTSELQSLTNLVCRLLLEKKKIRK